MLEEIKVKAELAGLQTKLTKRKLIFDGFDEEERTELFIQVPNEREFKTVILDKRNKDLPGIEKSNFEKYKFLKGFEAIYSTELGIIECEILANDMPSNFILKKLAKFFENTK